VSDVADHLRAIDLFARVSPEHLEALAELVILRGVEAGGWLFHAGDPGDSMFVVTAGRVDLVLEGPQPEVIVSVGRGESIGELALVTGEPRPTGARARRDSELIEITRDAFHQLLEQETGFAFALVRELGERMRVAPPVAHGPQPPRTIALVPLHDGAPTAAVADELFAELAKFGTLTRLDGPGPVESEVLDRLEASHRWVLLSASSVGGNDPWARYCIREADRVIALADHGPGVSPAVASPQLRGCDLAFRAPPGVEPDLTGWVDALDPLAVYVLREGSASGVDRMARRLAGRALGLVLGGGGARGFAHVGVVEELQQSGVVIDRLGGASMGGVVASLFAEQRSPDEVASILEALYVRTTPLAGRTIPLVALSRAVQGFAAVHELHGQRRIEGLDIPFYCVSSDIAGQQPVVHRRGLVADAVSATQALPALVPPLKLDDYLLVDGSLFSNLPVEPMRSSGEGPVIAVDVSGRLHPPGPPRSRVPAIRRWIVGPAADWAPPITETLLRSFLLGNAASDAAARLQADLLIEPRLTGIGMMDFRALARIRQLGREAARAAIAAGNVPT